MKSNIHTTRKYIFLSTRIREDISTHINTGTRGIPDFYIFQIGVVFCIGQERNELEPCRSKHRETKDENENQEESHKEKS